MPRSLNGIPLSENTSEFLRGDGIWSTPSASGGASPLIVNLISDAANATWTNMPAAAAFFMGSYRHVTKVDLTGYTEVRLVANKQATAGAAGAVMNLKYAASFSTTVGSYADIGTSSVQFAINVTNTVLATAWVPLAAGAKADVFLAITGSGGDGVLDPAFGAILAQFR